MAGDADEEMIESSGEDLEIDMNSQSLKICRCGAYDKIMSATNLLRKRILEAVNNELDQYEQPLGCLLGSSKQIFADCHKEYGPVENDRVILDSMGNSLQMSSQSQSQSSELNCLRSPSIDVIINEILNNASLLLLSQLK